MQLKSFACSTYRHLSKLALAALLMFSAAVSSQDQDGIVYDMVATVLGGTDIDHVDHVEVRHNNPSFYWNVGLLPEGDRARHSDVQPRKVPESLILSWDRNGEHFDEPFTIKMPPRKLLQSIRDSAAVVDKNGGVSNKLELLIEISLDHNVARVYWHVNRMPRPSQPRDNAPTLTRDAARQR